MRKIASKTPTSKSSAIASVILDDLMFEAEQEPELNNHTLSCFVLEFWGKQVRYYQPLSGDRLWSKRDLQGFGLCLLPVEGKTLDLNPADSMPSSSTIAIDRDFSVSDEDVMASIKRRITRLVNSEEAFQNAAYIFASTMRTIELASLLGLIPPQEMNQEIARLAASPGALVGPIDVVSRIQEDLKRVEKKRLPKKMTVSNQAIVYAYEKGYRVRADGYVFQPRRGWSQNPPGREKICIRFQNKNVPISLGRFAAYCFLGDAIFSRGMKVTCLNNDFSSLRRDNIEVTYLGKKQIKQLIPKTGKRTLTEKQVDEVELLIEEGVVLGEIAQNFGVSVTTISRIKNGKTYQMPEGVKRRPVSKEAKPSAPLSRGQALKLLKNRPQ